MENVPWALQLFFQADLFEVSSMNIVVAHSQKIVDIHLRYSLMFTIFFATHNDSLPQFLQ
jgi:hypothetical protein